MLRSSAHARPRTPEGSVTSEVSEAISWSVIETPVPVAAQITAMDQRIARGERPPPPPKNGAQAIKFTGAERQEVKEEQPRKAPPATIIAKECGNQSVPPMINHKAP